MLQLDVERGTNYIQSAESADQPPQGVATVHQVQLVELCVHLFPDGNLDPYAFIVILWWDLIWESSSQSYYGGVTCYK